MADEISNREAGESTLMDLLWADQATYSAVLKPIIEAVRRMTEAVESLPITMQPARFELLREFVATARARATGKAFERLVMISLGRFHRLAGN
jgi:hypothetical protein